METRVQKWDNSLALHIPKLFYMVRLTPDQLWVVKHDGLI